MTIFQFESTDGLITTQIAASNLKDAAIRYIEHITGFKCIEDNFDNMMGSDNKSGSNNEKNNDIIIKIISNDEEYFKLIRGPGHLILTRMRRVVITPGYMWNSYDFKGEKMGKFSFIKDQTYIQYSNLFKFVEDNKRLPKNTIKREIYPPDIPEHNLTTFLKSRCNAHRRGELKTQEIDRLESIPGWDWHFYLSPEDINCDDNTNTNTNID